MPVSNYWADDYVTKQCSAEKAISHLQSGQRVFIGSSCGEPQHLVRKLGEMSKKRTDIEIVRLMALETTPLTLIASNSQGANLNIRHIYMGSAKPKRLARNSRFVTPMNLSAVPRLFTSRLLPIHVALIQTTPPDDFGWMSLGVSVDITMAAALSADLVIAQINPKMPRVMGRSFLHVNQVDLFVEHEEPLLSVGEPPETEDANIIGKLIARLIDDGSTLQISPGTSLQATMLALSGRNDLGVHTQYLTSDVVHLYSKGVVTNRKKGLNNGKIVASTAIGTEKLYEFINDNPVLEFHPSDYVNNPSVIARHNRMVSVNVAMAIDLTGQVAADALPYNNFSGVTGMLDFIRGSSQSVGGKSFIIMPSTSMKGAKSRIVPMLDDTAVVVPRADVQYIVTEYGVVNLFGKSLQDRAIAMISIAHPKFRDELFHKAKEMKLFGRERTLEETIHGVYPLKLEETIDIDGEQVTIRPTKPVDERRIQEHFYGLDKDDVISRFFHEKTSFLQSDVKSVSRIDYINALSIIAVVGEFGFGKVIAIGEYQLDENKNLAEIAFSVSSAWQGKGLGKILQNKLCEAARENGVAGLMAYTSLDNKAMTNLFRSLPYKVKTSTEEDMVLLMCRFDEPKS
jgi:acyl-CoA hydrolase/GNAT superfamily N-acetyltransferase